MSRGGGHVSIINTFPVVWIQVWLSLYPVELGWGQNMESKILLE